MVRFLLTSILVAGTSLTSGFSPSVPAVASNNNLLQGIDGLNVEFPDFGELFERIQEVSPLAKMALTGDTPDGVKGLKAVDDKSDTLRWKRIENNPRATVHQIDKIDSYNGKSAPVLRFRSSMKGPLVRDASLLGTFFGRYIIDLEERKKWDAQIEQVYEIKTIEDVEAANDALGLGQFGTASRVGIGYGQTKKALGLAPREQLFIYGMQELPDGSCLIWGTEMDEKCNHLMPEGKRLARAKSHLFAATLVPTGDETFDVEYVLQLCIGGGVPTWLTTPVMVDTVKNLFKVAEKEFRDFSDGVAESIENFLNGLFKDEQGDPLTASLLMTP